MADFSWLRLGQRSRTPSAPLSPASPEAGPARVPSHSNLASHSSISLEILADNDDIGLLVREQDKIWHNPSLDQMVEALQVRIMTQGSLLPIPIEYNSYILHLIDGFAKAQERIRMLDDACAEAKYALDYHRNHFQSIADEWIERESQYKAEIKRLEVLLSRTSSDGLEAVTLARTNSVVDRNGPQAKQFVSKLKSFHTNTTQGEHMRYPALQNRPPWLTRYSLGIPVCPSRKADKCNPKPIAKILDKDNDFLMSEKIRRNAAAAKAAPPRPEGRRPRHERAAAASPRPANHIFAKERKVEKQPALPDGLKSQPLFADDICDISDTAGKVAFEVERKNASPSRSVHGHSSSCGRGQMTEGTSTEGLDYRRLRGLSGFSFLPGDDISPSFTDRNAGNETAGGIVSKRYDEEDTEQYPT
ncbi:hypothetical protein F4776DRAFT_652086 [Hypoxylon sp. NC0597]|nr:hypothetical protein F4776DRAFT_652086 [Hypoxylon sp. NC0597]